MACASTAILLALLVPLALGQNITKVTLFDGVNCSSGVPQDEWEPGAQDATNDGGNCVETLPATAHSARFTQFQPGCTATVYSDTYCSYNATLAELNTCADLGSLEIRSFSIDGCDVPFSESGNTSSTTSPTATKHKKDLSTAAKAGIGVGVACGTLLAVAIGVVLWLRHRRSVVDSSEPMNNQPEEPKELSGDEIFELNSPRGSEMPAEKEKQEMSTQPKELRTKSSLRIVLPELEGDRP